MNPAASQSDAPAPDSIRHLLPATDVNGWVLFDGDCGICRRLAKRYRTLIRRQNLDLEPLQAEWVNEVFQLPEPELMRDIRLLLTDGTRLQGANVYRYVARRTWWLWPLWLLSVIPGISHLVNWLYRTFADNRHRFSRTCNLS